MSQSPQTGQFNSYLGQLYIEKKENNCLNPLKRVNSILTYDERIDEVLNLLGSQSPQTGQFNSYTLLKTLTLSRLLNVSIPSNGSIQFLQRVKVEELSLDSESQSPQTGQFNSYFVLLFQNNNPAIVSLNPLKRVNSILTMLLKNEL